MADRQLETTLDEAAASCARHGARLTAVRRAVLALILEAGRPIGAYDILAKLRDGRSAAPPTVYRALDFLVSEGLVHRLERLAAYVGCAHHHHEGDEDAHTAQFLICTGCGRVTELDEPTITTALSEAGARTGFRLRSATVEAAGLCVACAPAVQGARGST